MWAEVSSPQDSGAWPARQTGSATGPDGGPQAADVSAGQARDGEQAESGAATSEAGPEAGPGTDPGAPQAPGRKRRKRSFLRELPILVVIALLLAVLIKSFALQAFYIPSGSM